MKREAHEASTRRRNFLDERRLRARRETRRVSRGSGGIHAIHSAPSRSFNPRPPWGYRAENFLALTILSHERQNTHREKRCMDFTSHFQRCVLSKTPYFAFEKQRGFFGSSACAKIKKKSRAVSGAGLKSHHCDGSGRVILLYPVGDYWNGFSIGKHPPPVCNNYIVIL